MNIIIVLLGIFSFYLILALVSYSPFDPIWSKFDKHETVHNICGTIGAWFSDILFFTFGMLAYVLPLIILVYCWITFIQIAKYNYVDLLRLSCCLIGILLLLLTSCGLAAININDFCYFSSGGMIGNILSYTILLWLNNISANLFLLYIWAYGVTILTNCSWITIAEKIGIVVFNCVSFVSKLSKIIKKKDIFLIKINS